MAGALCQVPARRVDSGGPGRLSLYASYSTNRPTRDYSPSKTSFPCSSSTRLIRRVCSTHQDSTGGATGLAFCRDIAFAAVRDVSRRAGAIRDVSHLQKVFLPGGATRRKKKRKAGFRITTRERNGEGSVPSLGVVLMS